MKVVGRRALSTLNSKSSPPCELSTMLSAKGKGSTGRRKWRKRNVPLYEVGTHYNQTKGCCQTHWKGSTVWLGPGVIPGGWRSRCGKWSQTKRWRGGSWTQDFRDYLSRSSSKSGPPCRLSCLRHTEQWHKTPEPHSQIYSVSVSEQSLEPHILTSFPDVFRAC